MGMIVLAIRAWLSRLHPTKRRALDKRRLQKLCKEEGATRAQAVAIASRFFKR